MRIALASLSLLPLLSLTLSLHAGTGSENAILIVDPANPESLLVANYYIEKRDIPRGNVLYMNPAPSPSTFADCHALQEPAFLGMLDQLGIADHIDCVILPSGPYYAMYSSGTINDGCYPVGRFALTTPYILARQGATLLTNIDSSYPNQYYSTTQDARAFDANQSWLAGAPSNSASAKRYFLGAMLGYTGPNGNTIPELFAMIDRSVAVDGTQPAGTFYFMQTTDLARSGPRHATYPGVSSAINALGGSAQHLFDVLPLNQQNCIGIMTGWATPDILNPNYTILPGAFADHLTSFAGVYEDTSQTKMSRWIQKGASGTSGSVDEPCNYPGKFPHARLHLYYRKGLSMGEAWLRSLAFAPMQQLFTGDPLTRPWASFPSLNLGNLPATASGLATPTPSGTATAPGAAMAGYELLVDGLRVSSTAPGGNFLIDTTVLPDGWHEWRLLGWDNTLTRNTARLIGSFQTQNHGHTAQLQSALLAGNLTTRFDLQLSAATTSAATLQELLVFHGNRVVASNTNPGANPLTVSLFGRHLGPGNSRLQLEARYSDGTRARSAPLELAIANTAAAPLHQPPIAYSYSRSLRNDRAFVLELPTAYDADFSAAPITILSLPAQATVLPNSPTNQPWVALQPNAGASGTDTLTFRVQTPGGISNTATITIRWTGDPCPPPQSYCVANANSTGFPAQLTHFGSQSHGANDLGLYATNCPPNKSGILLYSKSAAQAPLGDGFRCLGSPISRLGVVTTDAFGELVQELDFSLQPFAGGLNALHPGDTAHFQLWYRDPGFGTAGTNLTDGRMVTICP